MVNYKRPQSRSEFQIGIICALPREASAVEALFDEYWNEGGYDYGKAPNDPNAYTLGRIGWHNVVLAHMPGMGKGAASSVAASFRGSFTNIRIALLVGVCGAVPTNPETGQEIFLGDVIVSDGVVQYDSGSRVNEGGLVRKDVLRGITLGRPNMEVRAALNKFRGFRGGMLLKERVVEYLGQLEDIMEGRVAGYPGVDKDLLHCLSPEKGQVPGLRGEAEDGMFVSRRQRSRNPGNQTQPAIHFGTVASGDTVMMSAHDRDNIAEAENIIGFEMEGAGVWDNFPCIVIKGVCDYADFKKNKEWQDYAAATAAACMKSILKDWVIAEEAPATPVLHREWSENAPSRPAEDPPTKRSTPVINKFQDRYREILPASPSIFEIFDKYVNSLDFPHSEGRPPLLSQSDYDMFLKVVKFSSNWLDQDWEDRSRFLKYFGFFWITSKQKEAATNSAISRHSFTEIAMERKSQSSRLGVVAFSFRAKGTYLQRSMLGLYQSTLFQLLTNDTWATKNYKLFQTVLPKTDSETHSSWKMEELEELLDAAFRQNKAFSTGRFVFLIDAFEVEESRQLCDITSFLRDIQYKANSAGIRLYVCLACPYSRNLDEIIGKRLIYRLDSPAAASLVTTLQVFFWSKRQIFLKFISPPLILGLAILYYFLDEDLQLVVVSLLFFLICSLTWWTIYMIS